MNVMNSRLARKASAIPRPLHRWFVAIGVILAGAMAFGAASSAASAAEGTGTVFFPNPVVTLNDFTQPFVLTDQKDTDYAALQPAYRNKTLTNLDGSGYLSGDYAFVRNDVGPSAFSPTNTFLFHRDNEMFEQVMAYYWATEAQKYIQSLGFGTGKDCPGSDPRSTVETHASCPIVERPLPIRIGQYGTDSSNATGDRIRFGKGGVDDAEDAEVILHEYGHAIQLDITPWKQMGGGQLNFHFEYRSLLEGEAHYWNVTVANVILTNAGEPDPDPACIMDWDATSYATTIPRCNGRLDVDRKYPVDLTRTPSQNGGIWRRALWDIRQAIGATKTDTIVLKAHFAYASQAQGFESFPSAAQKTVDTAADLYGSGSTEETVVRNEFCERLIPIAGCPTA